MKVTETAVIVTGMVLLYAGIKGFNLIGWLKAVAVNPKADPNQYYVNSLVKPGEKGKFLGPHTINPGTAQPPTTSPNVFPNVGGTVGGGTFV